MPTRRSVWLYDYDHVKFRTPLHWALSFAAGLVLAVLGCTGIWVEATRYRSGHGIDGALLPLSAMCVAIAVIELPAALIYFYRRTRGEPTDYFDYEVIDQEKGSNGVHHGSDNR
jgi:hypothetical protein